MRRDDNQTGMVLLMTLFACLTVAVVVQVLCTVTLITERAGADQARGSERLREKDEALVEMQQRCMRDWRPGVHADLLEPGHAAQGVTSDIPESGGWLMRAQVQQPSSLSVVPLSATLERARDGLDLPDAAVVAKAVTVGVGRETPWLEGDIGDDPSLDESEAGGATGEPQMPVLACVGDAPSEKNLLGAGCKVEPLRTEWRLDDGWRALLAGHGSPAAGDTRPTHAALGEGVAVVEGRWGHCVSVPTDIGGASPSAPALIVVMGGADLDARGLGDFYGVVVVDDGSVLLDGTTVHGAVAASQKVSLGANGRIAYCREVHLWAKDRSLVRVRLVPGSRWEGAE